MSDVVQIGLPAGLLEPLVEAVAERVLAELADRDERGRGWPEWMDVETASRYMDISPERVRKLIARRALPYYQEAPNCRVFFHRPELDEHMRQQRQPARGEASADRQVP